MDCSQARLLLHFAGRALQELDPADLEALDGHLEHCPDCAVVAERERQLDEVIARTMHAVSVPDQLQQRLLKALERKPWSWPWIAAAACLLIALGLGGWWLSRPHQDFSVEEFASLVDARTAATPEAIENHFAGLGVPLIAPRQFDFDLLESAEVCVLKGQRVPRLTFFHRGETDGRPAVAHVYVLSRKQFDLGEEVHPRIPTSSHILQILRSPDVPGFVYLVVHTGSSLDAFLKNRVF